MDLFKIKNKAFLAGFRTKWTLYTFFSFYSILSPILDLLAPFIAGILIILGICGCASVKYVPIEKEEKIIIRDSLIYLKDTIAVEVPVETIKEILPEIDTSVLETSIAKSMAYLDTTERKLHHTLEQKGELKTTIDTFYITKVEEKIVYQDKPIPVEVPKRDNIFWYSIIFNIGILLFLAFKLYLKLKY